MFLYTATSTVYKFAIWKCNPIGPFLSPNLYLKYASCFSLTLNSVLTKLLISLKSISAVFENETIKRINSIFISEFILIKNNCVYIL